MPLHVVLVEPEIPMNAGNVARTCACTGLRLHLIQPVGFAPDDRRLRRAAMDYWYLAAVEFHNSFDEFVAAHPGCRLFFAVPRGGLRYTDACYRPGDCLVFGRESTGLPEELLERYPGTAVHIPMLARRRSLNLATAVGVVAFEALRQLGFPGLE